MGREGGREGGRGGHIPATSLIGGGIGRGCVFQLTYPHFLPGRRIDRMQEAFKWSHAEEGLKEGASLVLCLPLLSSSHFSTSSEDFTYE